MENYIGTHIYQDNQLIDIQILKKNEIILLYIGAQWSPPCRNFFPELKKFYTKVNRSRKFLEIIFISCDKSLEDFDQGVSDMPWCYIPFREHGIREIIIKHYELVGIPSLLLINQWGACISDTCIADIANLSKIQCVELWESKISESHRPSIF
jgi:thiol-disulfide isomerase/thioredoxin